MMRKIVGIGETVMDIIFRNDSPSAAIPGGSTFNAMISLGRTVGRRFPESPILMVTQTGDDHVGDIVTSFMESNGVIPSAVTREPDTQTHISLAFLDEDNNADYEFYKDHASARLDVEKIDGVDFQRDDLVLFGSYFAINPVIREFTLNLLRAAHDAGAVLFYDINFRKSHVGDLDETLDNILENCRLSDFVRGSNEDFGYLFGTKDPETVYEKYVSELCPNFICTCGSEPVHVFTPEMHLTFPVEDIETVSTIGAGDNFNAGFIYALLSGDIGKEAAGKLSEAQWKDIVGRAEKFSLNVCRSIYNYVDEGFDPEK